MNLNKILDPATTAILVVDKQAAYFDRSLVRKRNRDLPADSDTTLGLIEDFITKSRKAGVEIVWTKMVEDVGASPLPISEIMRSDPDDVHSISLPGDPSFEIYGPVKPTSSEKVITKYRYDAFSQTDLAEYLSIRNISTVIFVGGYASRCILSTIVGANGQDLFCIVPTELVLNQSNATHEMPVFYDIVNAIFGLTLSVKQITSAWNI